MMNEVVKSNLVVWALSLLAPRCSSAPLPFGPWSSPCLALGGADPITSVNLADTTSDLINRTYELLRIVNNSKTMITEKYLPVTRNRHFVAYLDTQYFLDADKTVATETKHDTARTNPISTLQEHFSLLSNLAVYVNSVQTDTNGDIHKNTNLSDIKETFRVLEEQIYNTICSVKIGILGQGADTVDQSTEGYPVDDSFTALASPITYELYRAYVVLVDSSRVMEYLLEIYETMDEASSQ